MAKTSSTEQDLMNARGSVASISIRAEAILRSRGNWQSLARHGWLDRNDR
jgi:hypothetical protein